MELHYGNMKINQSTTDRGGGALDEDRGEEEGEEEEEGLDVGEVEAEPQWFVQIWLRNDSTRGPYKLTIPGNKPYLNFQIIMIMQNWYFCVFESFSYK